MKLDLIDGSRVKEVAPENLMIGDRVLRYSMYIWFDMMRVKSITLYNGTIAIQIYNKSYNFMKDTNTKYFVRVHNQGNEYWELTYKEAYINKTNEE